MKPVDIIITCSSALFGDVVKISGRCEGESWEKVDQRQGRREVGEREIRGLKIQRYKTERKIQ